MIPPIVHLHICALWHVATDALGAGGFCRVMVMIRRVIDVCAVALCAQPVAFRYQLSTMWIMAIGAGDALLIHLALQE